MLLFIFGWGTGKISYARRGSIVTPLVTTNSAVLLRMELRVVGEPQLTGAVEVPTQSMQSGKR